MKCYKVQASCILFTNYFIMRSYMFTSRSSVIIYKEPFRHRDVIKSNQPLKLIYLDGIYEIRINICVLFFRFQEMLQRLYFKKSHVNCTSLRINCFIALTVWSFCVSFFFFFFFIKYLE